VDTNNYRLFNPVFKKYLFVSNDIRNGDNMVEAHGAEGEARNNFQFIPVGERKYKIFNPTCNKYLFVSNDMMNGDNVVEAHPPAGEGRNDFDIQFPEEKSYKISNVKYDLSAALTSQNPPLTTGTISLINDTNSSNSCSNSVSVATAESSNWSAKLGLKVGVKASFEAGIPFFGAGKVEVSAEVSTEYAWGGSSSTTKTLQETVSANVPAQSKVNCTYSIVQNQITVPYSGTISIDYGTFKMDWPINGSYAGVCNTHMVVHYDNVVSV